MSFWRGSNPPVLRSGQPAPLGPDERRNPQWSRFPRGGTPIYVQHRQPSVGADGFSYQAQYQQLGYNPIGAGNPIRYGFRPQGQAPSRNERGVIVFGFQQINYGRQPELGGPLWPPGVVQIMLGNYDAASKLTAAQAWGARGQ